MLSYALIFIAMCIVLGLGVLLMERLLRLVRPLTPKQEEAEHFRQQARRRLDRFLR
jgi:hypothetical protein